MFALDELVLELGPVLEEAPRLVPRHGAPVEEDPAELTRSTLRSKHYSSFKRVAWQGKICSVVD